MTKKFQEAQRMTVDEALEYYGEKEPKGEYVVTVSGMEESDESEFSFMSIEEQVEYYEKNGFNKKEAIKKCAEERNVPKREVYNLVMKKG